MARTIRFVTCLGVWAARLAPRSATCTVLASAAFAVIAALCSLRATPANAQAYDARRMGMGGVVLSEVSTSTSQNVAYRAVPPPTVGPRGRTIPLPLGLIQVLANLPVTDPSDPDFNIFEIMQLIAASPYAIQLVKPEELSSDVIVDVGQNQLAIDLGELQRLFPDDDIRYGLQFTAPNFEIGQKNWFVGIRGQAEARNSMRLSPELQGALGEGEPFRPNTDYLTTDHMRAQGLGALTGGAALPIVPATGAPDGDPRKGGTALYGGVRFKYLRGIALMEAQTVGRFTTGDTIFGESTPIEMGYVSDVRLTHDPGFDVGDGTGFDAGVAFFTSKFEIGLGVNDIGSTIHWQHTDVDRYTYDSSTNSNVQTRIESDVPYDLKFPITGFLNLAYRTGGVTWAGTLERTQDELLVPRAGAEWWVGPTPLRAGVWLDTYRLVQGSIGSGFRVGHVGLDVAVATHSRGITTDRGVELAASLALN